MAALQTNDYQRDAAEFTDAFRTIGDLVQGIFVDRTVDVTQSSYLNVLLASISLENFDGANVLTVGNKPWGTGGLGAENLVRSDCSNVITGTVHQYKGYDNTMLGDTTPSGMMFQLPNQELDIASPREMTALNWVDLLTWYKSTFSSELKRFMRESGRTRRDLKHLAVTIKSPLEFIAGLSYNSQKNGVASKAFASFNTGKWDRSGQQGPPLMDVSSKIGPTILAGENEWTRTETANIQRIGLEGHSLTSPPGGYCSSFVGEPQGKKSPTPLVPDKVPSSLALGSNDLELAMAGNSLQLPLDMQGEHSLRMVRATNGIFHNNNRGQFSSGRSDQKLALGINPNLHPVEGFKRGFVLMGPSATPSGGTTTEAQTNGYMRVSIAAVGTLFSIAASTPLRNGTTTSHITRAPRPFGMVTNDDPNFAIDTLNTAAYYHASGKAYINVTYGDTSDARLVPRAVYLHDFTNTFTIGGTNHELYGEFYNDVTLYAAQSEMVDVTSGAIHTRDMQDVVPTNYSSMNATFMPTSDTGTVTTTLRNVGCVPQVDVAFYDGRVEQDTNSLPALTHNNLWFDRKDLVSEDLALAHMEIFDLSAADALVTVAAGHGGEIYRTSSVREIATIDEMSVYRRAFSTINGNHRTGINPSTGSGLNATSGRLIAAVVFPKYGGPVARNSFFDGPAPAPMNNDGSVMLIQGYGRCKKGYMSVRPFSVLEWFERTILDASFEKQSGPYPLSEFSELLESPHYGSRSGTQNTIMPLMPVLAPIDDDGKSPVFRAHHNLSAVAHSTQRWFVTEATGVKKITPQWFRDLRGEADEFTGAVEYAGTLGTPWLRSGTEKGYEVQTVSHAKVNPLIRDKIATAFASKGEMMEKGYTDTLFIQMNTQGV
jgi:hypothetical protein